MVVTNYDTLKRYASDMAKLYPHLSSEIADLLEICRDEIAEGGSEAHEVELFARDIELLLLDHLDKAKAR